MKFKFNPNNRLFDHLIQAILIFASVFLAFWLTERRSENEEKRALAISLQQIASELAYNHQRLEYIYDYYVSIMDEMVKKRGQMDNPDDVMYGYELESWVGLEMPFLRSTAYQAFLNTGVSDAADIQVVKTLGDIYIAQQIIERIDEALFSMIVTDLGFTELDKVQHLASLYLETIPQLMSIYQDSAKPLLDAKGYDLPVSSEYLQEKMQAAE